MMLCSERKSSKHIDITPANTFHTSYNTFVENNNYIQQETPLSSPAMTPSNDSNMSTMKKSLSLDNFWPNTPPSFSPKKNMLDTLRSLLTKQT